MKKVVNGIDVYSDGKYYEILKLSENASKDEIYRVGFNMLQELDNIEISEEELKREFKLRRNAMKLLLDPEARKAYDEMKNGLSKEEYEAEIERLQGIIEQQNKELANINEANNEVKDAVVETIEQTADEENEKDLKTDLVDICQDIKIDTIEEQVTDELNDISDTKDIDEVKTDIIDVIEQASDKEDIKEDFTEVKKEDKNTEKIFNDTEEEKVQKVEKVEDGKKAAEKGKKEIKMANIIQISGISLLCISGLVCVLSVFGNAHRAKTQIVTDQDEIDAYNHRNKKIEISDSNNSEDYYIYGDDTTVYNGDSNVTLDEDVENEDVTLDVNNEQVINNTITKIMGELSKIENTDIAEKYNSEIILSLVKYTRDNTIMTGEDAYGYFSELYKNGVDISLFFENIDSEAYMRRLYNATKGINVDNKSYDDEYNAFLAINEAVESLKEGKYAELWAERAIIDDATCKDSMILMTGEAELNNKEGQEYQAEYNSIPANYKEESKNIYNKVRTDEDSYLRQLSWDALDKEVVRTR